MPFVRVRFEDEPSSESLSFPLTPDQIPLFLIPDILGNGTQYRELIEELRANRDNHKGDNRPVFVWCDPLLVPDEKRTDLPGKKLNLQEQAQLIAECMQECLPGGSAPYLIAGYSYGCSLAALTAEILTNDQNPTHVYLIDGPSPECSKKYFSHPSVDMTTDLINIVRKAMELSSSPPLSDEELSTLFVSDLDNLLKLTPQECLDVLQKKALGNEFSNRVHKETFLQYMHIVKQGIENLINAPSIPKKKTHKLVSLITDETAIKYQEEHGGWEKYTETLSKVEDESLLTQKHGTLLKQTTVQSLVKSIRSLINQELKPLTVFQQQLASLIMAYHKIYPTTPISGPVLSGSILGHSLTFDSHTTLLPRTCREEARLEDEVVACLHTDSKADPSSSQPTVIESFSDDEDNKDIDLSASQIVASLGKASRDIYSKDKLALTLFGGSSRPTTSSPYKDVTIDHRRDSDNAPTGRIVIPNLV